jgi:hypothetical protein
LAARFLAAFRRAGFFAARFLARFFAAFFRAGLAARFLAAFFAGRAFFFAAGRAAGFAEALSPRGAADAGAGVGAAAGAGGGVGSLCGGSGSIQPDPDQPISREYNGAIDASSDRECGGDPPLVSSHHITFRRSNGANGDIRCA